MESARSAERERRAKKRLLRGSLSLYFAAVSAILMFGWMTVFFVGGRLLFPKADLNAWPAIVLFVASLFSLAFPAVFVAAVVWLRAFISKRGRLRAMRWIIERRLEREPPSLYTRCVFWAAGVHWRDVLQHADEYRLFND